MTKERRLAIQMWEEIVEELKQHPYIIDIDKMKFKFCERHHLNWLGECWFCQYIRRCGVCPIKYCRDDYGSIKSLYSRVARGKSQEERIEAAKKIVSVLKGERRVSRK